MMNYNYRGSFAGFSILFSFRYPETSLYFREFLSLCHEDKDNSSSSVSSRVIISEEEFDEWNREWGMLYNGNSEFGLSIYHVSDELLKYNCCAFHGAAFLWNGKAWLLSADSGTGKSTQIVNWMNLYHKEICVMNGDKPVLSLGDNGSIMVHPSPWKGKEEWGDDRITAPLGGIIWLQQDKENKIELKRTIETAPFLFSQFFSSYRTIDNADQVTVLVDAILKSVPVWKLKNRGDISSAELTHDTILAYLEEQDK